jgi:predicted AlkP superfamily pyrophosphatase or phosphodiesterase
MSNVSIACLSFRDANETLSTRPMKFALPIVLAFAALSAAQAAPIPPKERIVILMTIDGFPAWMWRDPTIVMPNLRRLAAEGAEAEAMTVSNPSITWINHTTLVTGVSPRKHGVLFNGLLVRGEAGMPPKIEQWRDKADLVRVPTLYDVAHASGLKTAQVDWVAILNSGTIDYEMLEVPKLGSIERELIDAGTFTADDVRNFTKGKPITWRDAMWTKAATHIIRTKKPNLLLFHPLTTDSLNHSFGPGSAASHAGYALVDRIIGDLLDALKDAGLRDRATIVVTTDHGFKKVQKLIYPNAALRDAGLVRMNDKGTVGSCDAYVVAQGGMAFAYLTDPAKRTEVLPRLRQTLAAMEGVDRVLDGSEGPSLGMPTPAENPGMGDLILYPKAGYAFRGDIGTEVVGDSKTYFGSHGYLSSDPELDGIFIASGYGIRPGIKVPRVANLDVAPTLAELLGVKLSETEGRILKEILTP